MRLMIGAVSSVMLRPIRKNEAFTPFSSKTSNINGVYFRLGPSSNDNATYFGLEPSEQQQSCAIAANVDKKVTEQPTIISKILIFIETD